MNSHATNMAHATIGAQQSCDHDGVFLTLRYQYDCYLAIAGEYLDATSRS